MIYKYSENPSYKLEGSYETIEEAVNSLEKIPSNAKYLIRKKIANGDLSFCGGYVWTDAPLDTSSHEENTSAREENIPVLDPDELRETINHMSNLNGSMRMGTWYSVNQQFSPLFEKFNTSMMQLIYEWAVQDDFCKRLQSLQPQGVILDNMRIISHLPFASKEDLREELIKHLRDCLLIIE